MKILFFGAKSYDIKSFDAYLDKEEYKDLDVVYIEPNLTPQTAMLAAGYEAVCIRKYGLECGDNRYFKYMQGKTDPDALCRLQQRRSRESKRLRHDRHTRTELLTGSRCRACDGTGSDGKPPHAQSVHQST